MYGRILSSPFVGHTVRLVYLGSLTVMVVHDNLCCLMTACIDITVLTSTCEPSVDEVCLCRIPDPEASKPDDWDEDAPREIVDEDAEKPEGWLDNEPEEIDDPGALHQQLDKPHLFVFSCSQFKVSVSILW